MNLLASKGRLVPLKSHTVSLLEFLSCLLLTKLLVSLLEVIIHVVAVSSIFCFVNCMVALWWIKQIGKRWNISVQNRIDIIRKKKKILRFKANVSAKLRGWLYEIKCPGYSPVKWVPRLAGMTLIFIYIRSSSRFPGMKMSRGIVLSLVQFDFSYSSAIIILNSAFLLGLSASRSRPCSHYIG